MSGLSRPISALKAPTKNSRIETVPPWAKNGRMRRSPLMPWTPEVSMVPFGLAMMVPKLMPFDLRSRVTGVLITQRLGSSRLADPPELGGDFIGQHLLKTETEQMRGIAAVGPRDHVAAEARRAARPAVARRARIGEAGRATRRPRRCCQSRRPSSDRCLGRT